MNRSLLVSAFLVVALGACGKKESAPAPAASTPAPVAAPAAPQAASAPVTVAPAPAPEQKPAEKKN